MQCRPGTGTWRLRALRPAALAIALLFAALPSESSDAAGWQGNLDSGGGSNLQDGSGLLAGSLGGSFQTGVAAGAGLRLETGQIAIGVRKSPEVPGDFNGDSSVNFSDFLLFAASYGAGRGEAGYRTFYDLDGGGSVDFADFILFAQLYGG